VTTNTDQGGIYGDKDKGLSYDFDELKAAQTRQVDSTDALLASRGPATAGGVDLSAIKAADPSFDDQDFITIARESFNLIRKARTTDHEKFDEGLLSPQLAQEVKAAIDGDVASHQHHLLPGLEIRTAAITGGQVTDGKLTLTVRLHLWVGSANPTEAVEAGTEWDEDWTFWRDPTIDSSATDRDHALRREADGFWMFAHKGWIVTSIQRDGADVAAG
jgi:predicted lipid-binding transport protein (Tim44 family)